MGRFSLSREKIRGWALPTLGIGLLGLALGISSIKIDYSIHSPQTNKDFISMPLTRSGCFIFADIVRETKCEEIIIKNKLGVIDGVMPFEFYYTGSYAFPETTNVVSASIFRPFTDRNFKQNSFEGVDPLADFYRRKVSIPGEISDRKFAGFEFGFAFKELYGFAADVTGKLLERMHYSLPLYKGVPFSF